MLMILKSILIGTISFAVGVFLSTFIGPAGYWVAGWIGAIVFMHSVVRKAL